MNFVNIVGQVGYDLQDGFDACFPVGQVAPCSFILCLVLEYIKGRNQILKQHCSFPKDLNKVADLKNMLVQDWWVDQVENQVDRGENFNSTFSNG